MKPKTFFALTLAITVSACANFGDPSVASTSPLESVVPHSVTLSVRDIDVSSRWYAEKLGFREVQRKEYQEFNTSLVFLELNGYRVELIRDGNAKSGSRRLDPPAHTASFGISQFAFRTEDLAAVKENLIRRNIPIVWEFENKELRARFIFIRDPDGNLIQYLQSIAG